MVHDVAIYLMKYTEHTTFNLVIYRGVARISQRGVPNSVDAFFTDKIHRLRQRLATFDSTQLHYLHYIVKCKH